MQVKGVAAVGKCTRPRFASSACCTAAICRICCSHPLERGSTVIMRSGVDTGDTLDSLISLPLFPLPNVLHPAQMGQLIVYEPKYLSLFYDLQASAAAGCEPKFGHILAAGSAPPALMQDSIGGLPNTGVCATVKSVDDLGGGRLLVKYQGMRRIKLLTVDTQQKPYPLAAAAWLDDEPADHSKQHDDITAKLERDVYSLLQQVVKYSQLLSPEVASDSSRTGARREHALLPDTVLLYAPPPPDSSKQRGVADYIVKAGGVAGAKIATWQRMGSVYGSTGPVKKAVQDPYQMARDQLAGRRRQELFSFAAAQMLELGLPERLALLHCRDTSARLQFTAAAVQPYLADLLARVSVKQAMAS